MSRLSELSSAAWFPSYLPVFLPIVIGFLAYLGGETSSSTQKPSRKMIFFDSFFLVLGFSSVFAVLGVLLNAVLAHSACAAQQWLSWIGPR